GSVPGILPDNTLDISQTYERIAIGNGGALAPYILTSPAPDGPRFAKEIASAVFSPDLLQSIDLVLTADKSKWSRVPVLEMATDPAKAYKHPQMSDTFGIRPRKMDLRRSPSVN